MPGQPAKKNLMKRLTLIFALICSAGLISFATPDSWTTYTSNDGHFHITFPGKPEESAQDDKAEDGTPSTIHFSTYSASDNEVYMAGWIDMTNCFPKDLPMKKMLENRRDGAATSLSAKEVTTITTNVDGDPYIEFTFATDDFVGKDRIYIINKFQYSIITIFSAKTGISASADKFITSFRHEK